MTQAQIGLYKKFWAQRENIPVRSIGCGYALLKRNTKPERCAWFMSVSVGPKFITVSALDPIGLDDSETMNVVTPFDIYPEEQAHIQYPNIPIQQSGGQVMTQPMSMVPQQQQPTVVIAPKFFNGNGSDNSSDSRPTSDSMPIDNFLNSTEPPSMVLKNNVKESQSISDKSKNDDIDFSNIVIKKAGI